MLFTIPNNGDNKEPMRKHITKNPQQKTLARKHITKNPQQKIIIQKHITKDPQQKTFMRKYSTKNPQQKTFMRKHITKNPKQKTFMRICMNHSCPRVGAYWIRPTNVFSRKRIPCICIIHFWMCARFMRFYAIRSRLGKTFIQKHPTKNIQQKTLAPLCMSFILGKTNLMKNAGHIHRRTYAAPGITTDD